MAGTATSSVDSLLGPSPPRVPEQQATPAAARHSPCVETGGWVARRGAACRTKRRIQQPVERGSGMWQSVGFSHAGWQAGRWTLTPAPSQTNCPSGDGLQADLAVGSLGGSGVECWSCARWCLHFAFGRGAVHCTYPTIHGMLLACCTLAQGSFCIFQSTVVHVSSWR